MIAHCVVAAIGVAVMAAPALFGYGGAGADFDHIIGPLMVSTGILAASRILRSVRWASLPLGIALLASTVVVSRPTAAAILIISSGVFLSGSAFVRGQIETRFGGGWSSLWKNDPKLDRG